MEAIHAAIVSAWVPTRPWSGGEGPLARRSGRSRPVSSKGPVLSRGAPAGARAQSLAPISARVHRHRADSQRAGTEHHFASQQERTSCTTRSELLQSLRSGRMSTMTDSLVPIDIPEEQTSPISAGASRRHAGPPRSSSRIGRRACSWRRCGSSPATGRPSTTGASARHD